MAEFTKEEIEKVTQAKLKKVKQMKSSSINFYKVLKGYENYFLNASIDYKEFLNLNSDEIVEDLYAAFNTSKTNCAIIEPNWYKQIFLEIEDHKNNKPLYIMTISYSTETKTFRVEITDTQANRVHNSNNNVFKLRAILEPDKWLFSALVKNGLFYLFNRCKEILQK